MISRPWAMRSFTSLSTTNAFSVPKPDVLDEICGMFTLLFFTLAKPLSSQRKTLLDSYQLSLVKKAQEIFYNAREASGGKDFRRMNGNSTFSTFAFPHLIPQTTEKIYPLVVTIILGTLVHFRHFSSLSRLGIIKTRHCFTSRVHLKVILKQ